MSALEDLSDDPVKTLVWVGSSGGALAYGLSKVTDYDLITEVASSNPELAGAAFGIAGGVALLSDFDLIELGD
jgi:uncharacterized membrane protein YuzA (DUF378 family)